MILQNHTVPEAACDKLILAHFLLQPMGGRPLRTSTNDREGHSEEGFFLVPVSIFKISTVSNFKEANKKLTIV